MFVKAPLEMKEFYYYFETPTKRIQQGTQIPASKYPFIVLLLIHIDEEKEGFCSGSLIKKDVVLTAAHCLPGDEDPEKVEVFLGLEDRNDRNLSYAVSDLEVHPDYEGPPFVQSDIALVFLERKVDFKRFQAIPMDFSKTKHRRHAEVIGYGGDGILRFAAVTVKSCHVNREELLCAESVTQTGDSGGPIIWNNRLIGVTSGRLRSSGRSIFSSLRNHKEFVRSGLRGESQDSWRMFNRS